MRRKDVIRMEELSMADIEEMDKEKTVVIIPVSPLEAHGPHLPVGTDILITEEICKELAKRLRRRKRSLISVLYPFQSFGYCGALKDFPGSVSMNVKTFKRAIHDLLESLIDSGFKYIVILTFHLDPFYIKAMHESINRIEKKYNVNVAEPLSKLFYFDLRIPHAGKEETSIMLYLYPYLVKETYKELKNVDISFSIWNFRKTLREMGAEKSYVDKPSEASADLGREIFKRIVEFCVKSVLELIEGRYENRLPSYFRYLPLSLQRR